MNCSFSSNFTTSPYACPFNHSLGLRMSRIVLFSMFTPAVKSGLYVWKSFDKFYKGYEQ